ncbi:MAG: hypothetical protein LBV34_12555 [Nocardiopsaceae bacterium]|jgi:hypothetical protein|nr:hypothetical protein [Nocardiopsaceae bacterium]
MSKNQAIMKADMQRRARKIAAQASDLADTARPMTTIVTIRAKRASADAAEWAKPRVDMARMWMALRMVSGSKAVQKEVAPKVSAMMVTAARKLDPPKRRSRRLPKVLAGTALLGAGAATAGAVAMRNKNTAATMPPPPMPARAPSPEQAGALDPNADTDRLSREADVNGLSKPR